MAEVTIRYTRSVVGHPEPSSQVTVERTDLIEALLAQGYAVEIPTEPEAIDAADDAEDATQGGLLETVTDPPA